MANFECGTGGNHLPSWGALDAFIWKVIPARFGGGRPYIRRYKDAWVRHNKVEIKLSAHTYNLPPELLAGVSWIEVGGDPVWFDTAAFEVRAYDWMETTTKTPTRTPIGDMPLHLRTTTSPPNKTSFGNVSIQLRTAAETLGIDPAELSMEEYRRLSFCLEQDVYNIRTVARHVRQLVEKDSFQGSLPNLSMDQVRVVGARYNRGVGLSLEKIKQNTSYGDLIVKLWPRLTALLQ